MGDNTFIGELEKQPDVKEDDNVFAYVWNEYERVIMESLITSFGLDFLVGDKEGGDVDTIHNVRTQVDEKGDPMYKSKANKKKYKIECETYDSSEYHNDSRYIEINKKINEKKKDGTLIDAYTGKKVLYNEDIDLDHVVAANEIHKDPGRILSGLDGVELANSEENLKPTNKSINRSMKDMDIDTYLAKIEAGKPERQNRIKELKNKKSLSDKERKELNKLNNLEKIDPDKMRDESSKSRKSYNSKIDNAYYTSKKFAVNTAKAAGTRGIQMGVRQAVGFVFVEIWFSTKDEIQNVAPGCSLKEIFRSIEVGVKRGVEIAKEKHIELIDKFLQGFGAGALSSITTTICNIFFTTAKNLVKCIRQMYASVIQAGKVLLFNPDNLMMGDRIKTTSVIIATGASVLLGTVVGEMIGKTPLGMAPVIGDVVQTFSGTLVSGLLSCSLLVFLDRSEFMNKVINCLNAIPSEVNDYAEVANILEVIAAKLAKIDIEKFKEETGKYSVIADMIGKCEDYDEINGILFSAYDSFDIKIPWEGNFDSFMGNKNNKLVFE